MKKFTSVIAIIIAVLAFTSCEKDVISEMDEMQTELKGKPLDFERPDLVPSVFCGEDLTVPLLAGKHEQVGFVTVKKVGSDLMVSYEISEPYNWTITETHLSVTSSLEDVPGYPRNPKIGLFNYNVDSHENVLSYTYAPIPIPEDLIDNKVYILAHAVVEGGNCPADFDALNKMLPTSGIMLLDRKDPFNSYFNLHISETGVFDGSYNGYCIDTDHGIDINVPYDVILFSSYDQSSWPFQLVDMPEHMDEVNWILNQDLPNDIYNKWDVQMAIWKLLELTPFNAPGAENYEALYQEALTHDGFVPRCNEYIGIISLPVVEGEFSNKQITIFPYKLPCDCGNDETAWAAGYAFGGNSWAMYFDYCVE